MNVILAQINGQVLPLPFLGLVVDDQLRLHDLKRHHKKYQTTRDLPPGLIICLNELYILGPEQVVFYPKYMYLQN